MVQVEGEEELKRKTPHAIINVQTHVAISTHIRDLVKNMVNIEVNIP